MTQFVYAVVDSKLRIRYLQPMQSKESLATNRMHPDAIHRHHPTFHFAIRASEQEAVAAAREYAEMGGRPQLIERIRGNAKSKNAKA